MLKCPYIFQIKCMEAILSNRTRKLLWFEITKTMIAVCEKKNYCVIYYSVLWHCWLGGRKGIRPVKTEWWGDGMVIVLERGADLHMAQLMPLPLTVSCFSKSQIGFTFLIPAHPGSPGQRAIKCVCVCVSFIIIFGRLSFLLNWKSCTSSDDFFYIPAWCKLTSANRPIKQNEILESSCLWFHRAC